MTKTILLAFLLASGAMAATVTLTMDEVATTPINGLAVTKGGVTFTFSNTAGNYIYHEPNGGIQTYVQDPSIEGNTSGATGGDIGVTFSVPVYSVQFGIAVSNMSPASPIASVSLYNNSLTAFNTSSFASSLVDPFAEAQFSFSSATPITNILITPTLGAVGAAIDNLTVSTVPLPATPVPTSLLLVLVGLAALTFYLAQRKFAFRG